MLTKLEIIQNSLGRPTVRAQTWMGVARMAESQLPSLSPRVRAGLLPQILEVFSPQTRRPVNELLTASITQERLYAN